MGMEVKLIELRDSATFIPAIAIRLWRGRFEERLNDPESHWLIGAAGYGSPCVLFGRLNGGEFTYDIFDRSGSRTWFNAHRWVEDHWDEIPDGGIVDVRVILGETDELPLATLSN